MHLLLACTSLLTQPVITWHWQEHPKRIWIMYGKGTRQCFRLLKAISPISNLIPSENEKKNYRNIVFFCFLSVLNPTDDDESYYDYHFQNISIAHHSTMNHTLRTYHNLLKELIPSLRSWLWHHRLPNVTTIEALPRLWWHLGVCGVTAMTENEVSISILSWYHKIHFKLGDVVEPNLLSAVQV